MKNNQLRQLLETKRAIKTILTLYEKKRMASNELAKLIGGSRSTPQKRFKAYIKLDLMKKEPIFDKETDKVLVMYSLTKDGEELARKLSYVLNETKEVYSLDKTVVMDLEKSLEKEGLSSWQELVRHAIHEKLLELKKKYPSTYGT